MQEVTGYGDFASKESEVLTWEDLLPMKPARL